MQTVKVMNTGSLVHLASEGSRAGFNRQLDYRALEKNLDPDGIHVITWTMVHEHKHGVKTVPHLRASVLMRVKGKEEPVEGWLDMSFEHYNSLKEVTQHDDGSITQGNKVIRDAS